MEMLLDKKGVKYIGELGNVLRKIIESLENPDSLEKHLKKAKKIIDKIHREYCLDYECDSLVLIVDNVYYNIIGLIDEAREGKIPLGEARESAKKYLAKLERLLPRDYREGSIIRKILGVF
ncbi:MAG: hypothetical protein GXO43_00555 [Crenarchaeota archaeon]|nr:hypothetical protein [Thermoproteota archaeon]